MPYIKQELRSECDPWITLIKNEKEFNSVVFANWILKHPLEEQDGLMNYILSILFIDYRNLEGLELIIKEILLKVYAYPERYWKYNRMIGLLYCIVKEFDRRKWWKGIVINGYYKLFLINLIDKLYKSVAIYENKKIEENGDLEEVI